MSDKLYKLIGKYALLLSILYLVSFAFNWTVNTYEFANGLVENTLIRANGPIIFNLLLNIVAALLVQLDISKYGVKTNYVFFSTVLYRPLGIVAFLLFLTLQATSVTQQTDEPHEF